jgi:hypothetical protein
LKSCDEYAVKTLRYLENELERQELEDFLSHLQSCASAESSWMQRKNSPQRFVDLVPERVTF